MPPSVGWLGKECSRPPGSLDGRLARTRPSRAVVGGQAKNQTTASTSEMARFETDFQNTGLQEVFQIPIYGLGELKKCGKPGVVVGFPI
jgi:hypothetical protein